MLMSAFALDAIATLRLFSRCSCAVFLARCFVDFTNFLTTVWVTLVTFLLFAIGKAILTLLGSVGMGEEEMGTLCGNGQLMVFETMS